MQWLATETPSKAALGGAERVLDPDSRVVLPVAEILGEHHLATERAGRFEDGRIPVRDPEALARIERGEHNVCGDVGDCPREGFLSGGANPFVNSKHSGGNGFPRCAL